MAAKDNELEGGEDRLVMEDSRSESKRKVGVTSIVLITSSCLFSHESFSKNFIHSLSSHLPLH